MSIEQQSYLNEILVRFHRDGSLSGAHQVYMDAVVDSSTSEIISERAKPATPLNPADVSAVLGDAFTRVALQVSTLEEQVLTLANERDALKSAANISAPAVNVISDRQFYQGLALRGFCTPAEALDAVRTGALPAGLRTFVDAVADADQRWATEMLLSGAKEFCRDHAFVAEIGAWAGLNTQALDAFWAQCSAL